ncbi:valine--tRNA ligase [Membranihabitans marinus]|uniref:valine--tRNA ligase n=1 Tax=Membranihabitans marinus TaxID=1227546 RepID=UPI001F015316|nr:valine--tRNA ligase [Membranihabitans marinus]
MAELASKYDASSVEDKWYNEWMEKDYFSSVPDEREPYAIVIPPPNVTGILHMGHMLNNSIQDILIRKARLDGKNACWVPGTDHASIATEAKVVQWLREKGMKKGDLTREEFLTYAWEWTDKYGGIILHQLKKLGASCDWSRTAFTMDESRSEQVIQAFIDMYNSGKLYRGLRMVNWDPEAKTVLSNEEVLYSEENSKLYHLKYPVADSDDYVVIATTRPETILADTGVAVHPEDDRYAGLKGQSVVVPIVNRAVPVIFDDYVDREFGTGALKVTPAHDVNDYEIGQRHNLEVINIFEEDATLNADGLHYAGQDRFEVRKAIVKELEEKGFLIKVEEYVNNVGRSERTKAVVEPRLSLQWYVNTEALAEPALKAVMDDVIRFFPENMKNTYRHWMENIRDWCISRQLWWGHRIPAYYYQDEIVAAASPEEALAQMQEKFPETQLTIDDLRQDEDVLDTWFSSWLWPFSVFNGMRSNAEVDYYYPTATLVTGWDIIFLWVARMVMAGYEWKGERPFKEVYFTGMVRDKQRRKMSKSLGNSPDALQLLADYGADGVRFGLLSSSPAGGDLLFDDKLCEQGRNFCNKMWNGLRLIKGWTVDDAGVDDRDVLMRTTALDWISNQFQALLAELDQEFEQYRLSEVAKKLYNFIWNEFFSWFLEMVKPPYGHPIDRASYERILNIYEELMIALHPFMPFITEEIYQNLRERSSDDHVMVAQWPKQGNIDSSLFSSFELVKDLVSNVRDLRNKNQIKQRDPLTMKMLAGVESKELLSNAGLRELLLKMAVVEELEIVDAAPEVPHANIVAQTVKAFVILPAMDVEEERAKLKAELDYALGFVKSISGKLSNAKFVNNAPAAVVDKERKKLSDGQARVSMLEESLARLK